MVIESISISESFFFFFLLMGFSIENFKTEKYKYVYVYIVCTTVNLSDYCISRCRILSLDRNITSSADAILQNPDLMQHSIHKAPIKLGQFCLNVMHIQDV